MVCRLMRLRSSRTASPPVEVDVGWREVIQALVGAAVVVVLAKGRDPRLEFAGQVVVFEQDAVLERSVPALDLALGLPAARRAAEVLHPFAGEPRGEVARDVAGPVVGEEPRPVTDPRLRAAGCGERQLQSVGDVTRGHAGAELPGEDVAREVVQHGREMKPAPAGDPQVGEVRLLQLVGRRGLGAEFVRRLDHDKGRAGDEVVGLEQAVDRGLGDEVVLLVGEAHRQLAQR